MRSSAAVLFILLLCQACTKHYASATTAGHTAAVSAESVAAGWKLDKVEIPSQAAGTQATNDAITQKETSLQNSLKGMTLDFNKDGTFQSQVNGRSDMGTWKISGNNIEALSKTSGNVTLFQIQSMNDNTMIVSCQSEKTILRMTFVKK